MVEETGSSVVWEVEDPSPPDEVGLGDVLSRDEEDATKLEVGVGGDDVVEVCVVSDAAGVDGARVVMGGVGLEANVNCIAAASDSSEMSTDAGRYESE